MRREARFNDEGHLHRPHPTSLREATFSHAWKKGCRRLRRCAKFEECRRAYPNSNYFARTMRREQTLAEDMLWLGLHDRRLGAKFRRQVPIGAFIADFACVAAKLAVKVDRPSCRTPAWSSGGSPARRFDDGRGATAFSAAGDGARRRRAWRSSAHAQIGADPTPCASSAELNRPAVQKPGAGR